MTVLLIRIPFFNTVSATPHWVPASFLSKANLRLEFASALLMCGFFYEEYPPALCIIHDYSYSTIV